MSTYASTQKRVAKVTDWLWSRSNSVSNANTTYPSDSLEGEGEPVGTEISATALHGTLQNPCTFSPQKNGNSKAGIKELLGVTE